MDRYCAVDCAISRVGDNDNFVVFDSATYSFAAEHHLDADGKRGGCYYLTTFGNLQKSVPFLTPVYHDNRAVVH